MKKNLAYISLAVTMIALLTIVFIRSTEENHQDPNAAKKPTAYHTVGLDEVFEVNDQEVTARKLFEAANEEISYADHVDVSASCEYSYDKSSHIDTDSLPHIPVIVARKMENRFILIHTLEALPLH